MDGAAPANNLKIVAANDAALQGAPGEAVQLQVVFVLADGGTIVAPGQVTWTLPATVVAQDPNDAGPNSVIPDTGAQPTGFFVENDYRQTQPGVLFVIDRGTVSDAGIQVMASLADAGQVSAVVAISSAPDAGDPTRGQALFQTILGCAVCHGTTASGTPPIDGGEAGVQYEIPMQGLFSYPAPGLNDVTTEAGPNVAADPAWNAALLGMAIQADIDNAGVALRPPMPDFFQATTDDAGTTLRAQDFADIYAWLKTQH
jgi:hypothetical protein